MFSHLQLKLEMREIVEAAQGSQTRTLADLDARVVALNQKIGSTEDNLEGKIQTVCILSLLSSLSYF